MKKNKLKAFIKALSKKPVGMICAIIVILLLLVGIFADYIAPYGMNETGAGPRLQSPNGEYIFGTDNLGRDVFSRIIYGARISMIVGLGGSLLATVISVMIGIVSGYVGGRFDLICQRFVDATMSFPSIIMLMVLLAIIGQGILQVTIVIGVIWGIIGSLIVRSSTFNVKGNQYIEAAKVIGCSPQRIITKHIFPNIFPSIIFLFTNQIPGIIVTEATLSFLGFGVPPPYPSWGNMLSGSSRSYMFQAPWMAIWPGVALVIVVYSMSMFGDALRDVLDPRLKGGTSRFGIRKKFKIAKKKDELQPVSSTGNN